jgi:RNA polymerase sigma-70 factor (ECF subfamily)
MWMLWAALTAVSDQTAADRAVIDRIAHGDEDGLAELYDRHGRLVYSMALRIVRDQSDAEDVVQDVFSQAWHQAARYDPARGSVVGWLLMLTRSRSIDRVRGRRSQPEPSANESTLDTLADPAPGADVQMTASARAAQVRHALEGLSLLQRVAIELAFFEGLTHAEIAERLELPLGTVKTRIRQGLLKLRDRLAGAQ